MIYKYLRLSIGLLVTSTATVPLRTNAQGGIPLWTNSYNGGKGNDYANAVAVDRNDNIFVIGSSNNGTNSDYVTIKYSGAGVALWTNRYNGPMDGNDSALALGVDGNGNVFVTGYSWNGISYDYVTVGYSNTGIGLWTNRYEGRPTALAMDPSGNVLVTGVSRGSGGSIDYATVSYSNLGLPLWTNTYNGPANLDDYAQGIAVDHNGNVFVTGYSVNTNPFNIAYATIAYSNNGLPLWTNRYQKSANSTDSANAVATDSIGHVFVTGSSGGDYATLAYSSAGLPLWTNRFSDPNSNGGDMAEAMAVASNGRVFVTGRSYNGHDYDYATLAYSADGVPVWTNRYGGLVDGSDYPTAIAVDSSANVFVTGSASSSPSGDYGTVAYSNAGLPLWTNRYEGPGKGDDYPHALAVDNSGNVFVTGYSWVPAISAPPPGGYFYCATIKYSSSTGPYLMIQQINDRIVLSWTNSAYQLQSAPDISGIYTNISDATSPYTNSIAGSQRYFRLTGQ
jgi:hypothetical protein